MRMVKLSETAIEICNENYASHCGRCPIRPEFVSSKGYGQEGLDAWRERVNKAVERVRGQ